MKKILSLFGIITLGLINFGYCVDLINPGDTFSINSTTSYSAGDDVIICASGGGGNLDYMGNQTFFNGNPPVCIILTYGDYITVNAWGNVMINGYSVGCPSCPSCSVCEMHLSQCEDAYDYCSSSYLGLENSYNTLSGNYNTCNNNLSSCSSDLQYCQSDFSDCVSGYDTLYSNLQSCQSDLSNCQNSSSCDYSGYILESEINSGYCLVNGLCPSSEICNDSDYSNLFIYSNNRYFPITGTNNIYVNLPSYLGYDYDYSNGGNDLDIDVGMVVDEDYIDGLNTVQNYKPTSEDFTELIGILAPYSKILIFCLFMFIIWAWIKKPFKSKKL